MPPAFVHPFGCFLPCISCVAQFKCELPAEIERTICCPSGGAAEGHFEDEEKEAACWVDVIVVVADGVLVLLMFSTITYTEGISTMKSAKDFFFTKKNGREQSRERCVEVTEAFFSYK